MKLKLYFFLLAFISLNFSKAQNYDHVYSKVIGIYQQSSWTSGQEYEIENFSNFSKCHININVNYTFDLETGGNGTIKMYAVNGSGENLINTINVTDSPTSNSFNVPANLLPIEGFLIKWTIGNTTSSNFIFESFTLTATSPEGTMPSNPLVEDVYYTVGQLANALTANGTNLKWYTSNSGGMPITTAPIPNTNTSSVTTYYVTQSDFSGCESKRQAINVYVGDSATHLNFDGVDDFIDCGNILPESYTKEAWISIDAINQTSNIISGSDSSGQNAFWVPNGVLSAGHNGFWNAVEDSNVLSLNTWYHVVVSYDYATQTLKLYKDGILIDSNNNVPAPNNGNDIHIGSYDDANNLFNGSIDEVRIWNVVRTEEQINGSKNCELQGDEAGLIAYYQFNEGLDANENAAFTTLNDATINANNGSLTNFALTGNTSNWLAGSPVVSGSIVPSEAIVSSPVNYFQNDSAMPLTATLGANGSELIWYTAETGQVGSTTAPTPSTTTIGATSYWVTSTNANGCESEKTEIIVNVMAPATHLSFDGVDDYVNINIGTFTTQNLNYTHEFWFKTTSANSTIFNFSDTGMPNSGGFNKTIYLQNGNLVSYVYNGSANYITSTTTFNDDNWHHVTEIVTLSERSLYVDGTLIGTDTSFSNQNFGYIVLGASNITPGIYFEGEIDEVRIWNTALSIDDVNSTGNCQLEGDEANLLAYYQFNQGTDATDNTSVTTLIDATTNAYNGNLINFSLTGNTSNWLAGSPIGIAPIVTSQPQNQTITETDDTVVFTVSATNVSSYQWEVFFEDGDGEGGTWMPLDDSLTNPDVSGSTTNTLTISGDNLSFIVGLQFRVVMNGTASCNVISNEVNVTDETLSVSTVLINEVKVFPNPTTDNVKISLSKVQDFEISVYDLNGRLLLNSKNRGDAFLLDLTSYQNGIYIIKTKIDQKEAINRVIKH
ncbi:LamG-like jellyroll fold domain-containing protein [Olleya marilimosa]|uniref:LamG-like jellyroll fold domain-containing protein n=1 Tax=Olleya marilimosa TaxID=272164 RepID=UPI00168D3407|nr:LamG-like jellyroll fold domain-containing protein [Olleya marilimosa]MBD3891434.1 T9SS type A sorting domain-containing protein [Olleya marilimosa]